jgi:hypothetical protein
VISIIDTCVLKDAITALIFYSNETSTRNDGC